MAPDSPLLRVDDIEPASAHPSALKKISLAGVALGRRLRDKLRGNKFRPQKLKWPRVLYSTPRRRDVPSISKREDLRTHAPGDIVTDGNKRQYTVHKDGSLRRS